jgi:hypothetical protein
VLLTRAGLRPRSTLVQMIAGMADFDDPVWNDVSDTGTGFA